MFKMWKTLLEQLDRPAIAGIEPGRIRCPSRANAADAVKAPRANGLAELASLSLRRLFGFGEINIPL